MQAPLFSRPLTADERATLESRLRSSAGFTVRRCQMLLASAEGQHTTAIARTLRCNDQTVRNAIHTFNQHGLAALQPKSSRPHTTQATFDAHGRERLQALLHQTSSRKPMAQAGWSNARRISRSRRFYFWHTPDRGW